MFIYYFDFGGLIFRIESEEGIKESPFYPSFRTDENLPPDINISVLIGNVIVPGSGYIYKSDKREFYNSGNKEIMISYFPDSAGSNVAYALREKAGNDYKLIIDYDYLSFDIISEALDLPEILLNNSCAVLHCSYIVYNNEALLFAGNKGVGKSTQASLWNKFLDATVINGDRAILRFIDDKIYAFGIPYCGSSDISLNLSFPVRAIVFPEFGDYDSLYKLNEEELLLKLLELISGEYYQNNKVLELSCMISASVSGYTLSCKPDKESVNICLNEVYGKNL